MEVDSPAALSMPLSTAHCCSMTCPKMFFLSSHGNMRFCGTRARFLLVLGQWGQISWCVVPCARE